MELEGSEVVGSVVKEVVWRRGECVGIPPITSLVWEGEEIVVADASGAISVVKAGADFLKKGDENKVMDEVDEVKEPGTGVEEESANNAGAKESGMRRLEKKNVEEDDEEDDAMFDDDDADSLANKPSKKIASSKFIDDEAEDNDDEATVELPASKFESNDPPSPDKQETTYEDFTQPEPQDTADADADVDEDMFQTHDDHIDDLEPTTTHPTTTSFPPLQPAFAPSSTPIHESRRILCWNHIGVVTTYPDSDSPYNVVDVAFHETAGLVGGRRPINFTDNLGFIVGTLGEEGALFASDLMEEEEDDDFDDGEFDNLGVMSEAARKAAKASRRKKKREDSGKGSQVYFNRFETFGRNADKDWVVGLPDGERVMGCATGKGWCGVITRFVFISSFYFFTICHLLTCPLIPSNAAEGSYVSLQMLVFKVQ
jgi:hypothetical protein